MRISILRILLFMLLLFTTINILRTLSVGYHPEESLFNPLDKRNQTPSNKETQANNEISNTEGKRYSKTDFKCLVETIYWEARSEDLLGMAAVAKVVLNRVNSGRYANTICGVVYQPRQFTWVDVVRNPKEIKDPLIEWVALKALNNEFLGIDDKWNDVFHYHAVYIPRPKWARVKRVHQVIGNHIFYKE